MKALAESITRRKIKTRWQPPLKYGKIRLDLEVDF
jgi:hypothetical protein